jgi:hypothetical protein
MNNILILYTIIVISVSAIGLLLIYLNNRCNQIIKVYPSCPNIPSSQCANNPVGLCLLECDQHSDVCYRNCNCDDEECIRNCYQAKANGYLKCLGPQKEQLTVGCGC